MPTFSERIGEVKPPEFMQLDGMNEELANGLLNICEDIIGNSLANLTDALTHFEKRIANSLKIRYDNQLLSSIGVHGKSFSANKLTELFMKIQWHDRYSFMEELLENYHFYLSWRKILPEEISEKLQEAVNRINWNLIRENSGYRLSKDLIFIPITSETELKEVEQTQKCEIESVRDRFNHAVSLFSDREKPDYANAVKEAISTMESLAQYYTGNPSGTLGERIMSSRVCKRTPRLISLPQPLKEAMNKLYGYASNEGDVRHSNNESDHVVTFNEAKFIIVTASALINYIIALNPTKKEPEK